MTNYLAMLLLSLVTPSDDDQNRGAKAVAVPVETPQAAADAPSAPHGTVRSAALPHFPTASTGAAATAIRDTSATAPHAAFDTPPTSYEVADTPPTTTAQTTPFSFDFLKPRHRASTQPHNTHAAATAATAAVQPQEAATLQPAAPTHLPAPTAAAQPTLTPEALSRALERQARRY